MKRVAIFGNAGAGKSTLAHKLAEITGLPLHVIDKIQFRDGGEAATNEEFLKAHADILRQDKWIVDGFGTMTTAWERFERADTLVHIDLPVATHYWWVTKRFIGGLFRTPPGWPKGSPLWSSTRSSYRVIGACNRTLTPKYRQLVAEKAATKRVHHLKSRTEIAAFLNAIEREYARA